MTSHPGIGGHVAAACVAIALGAASLATAAENPYRVIVRHNAFDLRPIVPPEPPRTPEPPPEPPIKVHLTGIVSLAGVKAFLQTEDPKTKKTEFLPPLAAGERYKGITVLGIDPRTQTVRIRHGDVEDSLDFLNDGLKPAVVAARPIPATARPIPRPVPTPTQTRRLGMTQYSSPTATPARGAIVAGGTSGAAPAPVPAVPTRVTRTTPIMSRAQVEARIAQERQIRMRNNDPTFRLLPSIAR
jgi:hypothetical protein